MTEQTVVIVGASHAAVQAVDTLRREGHTGRIVLVGGGGTLSLMTDAQGKTFSTALLRMYIEVPEEELATN